MKIKTIKTVSIGFIASVMMFSVVINSTSGYQSVSAAQTKKEVKPLSLVVNQEEVTVEANSSFDAKSLVLGGQYEKLELPIIDTNKLGEQVVVIKATQGLESLKVTAKITVKDSTAPEWTQSVDSIDVKYNEEINILDSFKAVDSVDGELEVSIEGDNYKKDQAGAQEVKVVATDKSGNKIEKTVTVNVAEEEKPQTTSVLNYVDPSASGSNLYDAGWCTWWVQKRRIEIGKPVSNQLGNAETWLSRAQARGYETGNTPRAGAVIYFYRNHVAFVEEVYADGSIYITEMGIGGAWGYNAKVISASEAANYAYIY